MPKRADIHKILIIGSGPIVIGQACEFDYSGTQACKALRQEGYEVVLVNSNPATIMTDPEMADRTYIEPLTVESVSEIIRKEKPDALLPTVGGQTALNLAIALSDVGILDECGVEMIGAKREAIRVAEDRLLFKKAMDEAGVKTLVFSSSATVYGDATRFENMIPIPGTHHLPRDPVLNPRKLSVGPDESIRSYKIHDRANYPRPHCRPSRMESCMFTILQSSRRPSLRNTG